MTTIQRASLQSPSAHTHTYPAWPLLSPPASCPPRCVALPPSLCPLPACLPCVCLLGQNSRAHDDATLRYSLHSHSHPSLSIHIHPSTNHARGSCSYIRRGLPTPPSLSLLARKPVTTQGSSASHPPTPPSPPAVRSGARTLVPVCARVCVRAWVRELPCLPGLVALPPQDPSRPSQQRNARARVLQVTLTAAARRHTPWVASHVASFCSTVGSCPRALIAHRDRARDALLFCANT